VWPRFSLLAPLWATQTVLADWPHVRGPNYDGVSLETGLADAWPVDGPRRLGSYDLGQGHSGIVVGDGRLFTQRQSATGQFLVCLDPATGQLLWETRYARPWQFQGAYPGPYATPTYSGGKVYFASPTGLVGCADAASGSIDWSLDVQERFGGRGYGFGFAATPLVDEGRVILPVGGETASLVALNAADGRVVWTAGGDPASYCPAYPITFGGRRCVVGYMENALVIAASADGSILHRRRLSAGYDEHSAWPIYREPHLLLTAPFRAAAVRWRLDKADGAIAATETWTSKFLSNDVASSVLYGDSVYGFDLKQLQVSPHRPSRGTFRCLDWATGRLCWSTDSVGHATVLAADGLLFLLGDTGELILARANPEKYEELGRIALFEDEICWTPPALWRGRLFVRSPSRLLCFDVAREPIVAAKTVEPLPAATGRRFDPSWLLTREREFPNDAPSAREARLWFGASLVLLGVAALTAIVVSAIVHWLFSRSAALPVFLAASIVLGFLGPNVLSAWADRCLFTWPLCLFAGLHAVTRSVGSPDTRAASWSSRMGLLAFLVLCAAYFLACRLVGMSVGWYYLFGLPFGLPFSAWADHQERRGRPRAAGLTLVAFTAFFWAGQALFWWKSAGGD
jgi:hypothetical protein